MKTIPPRFDYNECGWGKEPCAFASPPIARFSNHLHSISTPSNRSRMLTTVIIGPPDFSFTTSPILNSSPTPLPSTNRVSRRTFDRLVRQSCRLKRSPSIISITNWQTEFPRTCSCSAEYPKTGARDAVDNRDCPQWDRNPHHSSGGAPREASRRIGCPSSPL